MLVNEDRGHLINNELLTERLAYILLLRAGGSWGSQGSLHREQREAKMIPTLKLWESNRDSTTRESKGGRFYIQYAKAYGQ